MKVLDLINRAYRIIGVLAEGETPTPAQAQDAFLTLNMMLDGWNTQEGMSISNTLVSTSIPPPSSVPTEGYSVTIGPTGTIVVPTRPVGIAVATLTMPSTAGAGTIDYPLQLLTTEEWNSITLKQTQTNIPRGIYFDQQYPIGNIFFWPCPSATCTLNLTYWSQVSGFVTVNDTVNLPPGWAKAIVYNLAVEMSHEFPGCPVGQTVFSTALGAKAAVKRSNHRTHYLGCDAAILGQPPIGYSLADFLAGR